MNRFPNTPLQKEDWKLVDETGLTYWSGLDAEIYINDYLVEEAIQLNYQFIEQLRPYWGYSSYIADVIHHGTRMIAGELSMNFVREGYLMLLINQIRNNPKSKSIWQNTAGTAPTPLIPGISLTDVQQMSAEQLKSAVDSLSKSSDSLFINDTKAYVPAARGVFEARNDGLDITIIYGSSLTTGKTFRYNMDDYQVGDIMSNKDDSALLATGIRIIGASFGGFSRTLGDDGRPLTETYTFQARDFQILSRGDIKGTTWSSSKTKTERAKVNYTSNTSANEVGVDISEIQ